PTPPTLLYTLSLHDALPILAAPIQQNLELLRELPDHVAGSAVVTDTGSTKREIVEAARSLPDRLTFIGGHPLGGAARGGIDHARSEEHTSELQSRSDLVCRL